MADYPLWTYYPVDTPPPEWALKLVAAVNDARSDIDTSKVDGLRSDSVLKHLRPHLQGLGYEVEASKKDHDKIKRPVLFGAQGRPRVSYEVDAVYDDLGIVIEVEAGRGARGNAVYRDLIRTSLIVGADYLALGVMREYRHKAKGKTVTVHSYDESRRQLDAIYASGRLRLPFEGVLLFGY